MRQRRGQKHIFQILSRTSNIDLALMMFFFFVILVSTSRAASSVSVEYIFVLLHPCRRAHLTYTTVFCCTCPHTKENLSKGRFPFRILMERDGWQQEMGSCRAVFPEAACRGAAYTSNCYLDFIYKQTFQK